MSIRERLKITRRGYSILREYCPGLIEAKILFALIESGSPFINIWLSAKIINEIANLRQLLDKVIHNLEDLQELQG